MLQWCKREPLVPCLEARCARLAAQADVRMCAVKWSVKTAMGAYLLHLRCVWRRRAIHVARDLRPQIRDTDELLEHVLRQHVRQAAVLQVLRIDIDVVHPQVKVGRRDGSHAPLCLAPERLLHTAALPRHRMPAA